jgi:hypothetical protein
MPRTPRAVSDYPFHRVQVGSVTVSICTSCLRLIAYSPLPRPLAIAEKAHKCSSPKSPKTSWNCVTSGRWTPAQKATDDDQQPGEDDNVKLEC